MSAFLCPNPILQFTHHIAGNERRELLDRTAPPMEGRDGYSQVGLWMALPHWSSWEVSQRGRRVPSCRSRFRNVCVHEEVTRLLSWTMCYWYRRSQKIKGLNIISERWTRCVFDCFKMILSESQSIAVVSSMDPFLIIEKDTVHIDIKRSVSIFSWPGELPGLLGVLKLDVCSFQLSN